MIICNENIYSYTIYKHMINCTKIDKIGKNYWKHPTNIQSFQPWKPGKPNKKKCKCLQK